MADVYFPEGDWYPWAGGKRVGGGTSSVAAPVEEIPVFARAGTVVPTYPPGVMTLVRESAEVPGPSLVGDDRVVYVFPGADGAFEEENGFRYELASTQGLGDDATVVYVQGGDESDLESCGDPVVAPCVEDTASELIVHVTGTGTVFVRQGADDVAELVTSGGSDARALTVRFRRL